jgi:hypothetical protein
VTSDFVDKLLRYAIEHRRLIEVGYHASVRIAEPHDYGIYKGTERLLAFQLRDSVHSPPQAVGWRLFDTAQIEECFVLEKGFSGSRGRLHQSHLVWDVVFLRVV